MPIGEAVIHGEARHNCLLTNGVGKTIGRLCLLGHAMHVTVELWQCSARPQSSRAMLSTRSPTRPIRTMWPLQTLSSIAEKHEIKLGTQRSSARRSATAKSIDLKKIGRLSKCSTPMTYDCVVLNGTPAQIAPALAVTLHPALLMLRDTDHPALPILRDTDSN